MSNNKKGKVYKIIYIGNENVNITYIGSTFNTLRDRWRNHKSDSKKKDHNLSIYQYFDKYGIDNFKMILIKEYEVIDRKHLEMYEQLWMNKISCINIKKAFQPLFKQQRKIYDIENKEYITERKKKYNYKNKEYIAEKTRKWYANNTEKALEYKKDYYINYKKEWYEKQKNEKSKKITCECGSIIAKYSLNLHLKSKKHIQYKSLNNL